MDEKSRLKRLDRLLDEALELSSSRQSDLIRKLSVTDPDLAKRLSTLLGFRERAGDLLEGTLNFNEGQTNPTEIASADLPLCEDHGLSGTVIGPWRLLEEIGSGGMGTVYKAARDDGQFNRHVAFKVIRSSKDSQKLRQRFAQERTVLASLRHKGIAQLLDSGVSSEGLPYYIMEYVEGQSILAYCDAKNLSVDQRLYLFLEVCDAIAYAHRTLVIHRDVKANNILVTDQGEVKLLDFGIAKVLQPEDLGISHNSTTMGGGFFTPDCAAPEQIKGETVTTATDVYALGVLLYRMLAGKAHISTRGPAGGQQALILALFESKPIPPSKRLETTESSTSTTLDRIAQERATSLFSLRRRLEGDLDAIVLKCLEHQPSLRYQQVSELMQEIHNHLEHRPVKARNAGFLYNCSRFARRNLLSVLTVTSFFSLLVAMIVLQSGNANELRYERNLARQEAARAQEMVTFLKDLFESANPKMKGGDLTVHELLLEGIRNIGFSQNYHPEVRTELLQVLGTSLKSLGDLQTARLILEDAARTQAARHGETSLDYAMTARLLALISLDEGHADLALTRMKQLIPIFKQHLGDTDPRWLELDRDYSVVLEVNNQFEEARTVLQHALGLAMRLPSVSEYQVGRLHLTAAISASARHDAIQAVDHGQQAIALLGKALGENHLQVADALVITGANQIKLERAAQAHELLARAQDIIHLALGDNSLKEANLLTALAQLAIHESELDKALKFQEEAFAIQTSQLNPDSVEFASAKMELARALIALDRCDEAEALLVSARDVFRKNLEPNHMEHCNLQILMGDLYYRKKNYTLALEQYTSAMAQRETVLGPQHPNVAVLWLTRAEVLFAMTNWTQAEEEFKRGIADLRDANPPRLRELTRGQAQLGLMLVGRSRESDAFDYLEAAYLNRINLPKEDQDTLIAAYHQTQQKLGKLDQVEEPNPTNKTEP